MQNPQYVVCNGPCGSRVEVWANAPIDPVVYECGGCQAARTEARKHGLVVLSPRARAARAGGKRVAPRWVPPPRVPVATPDGNEALQLLRATMA